MSRRFRFGVQRTRADTPEKVAGLARLAEELGYEDYWTSDHIGNEDPFVSLMVASQAAPTLRVGPLVLNNELHHPVLLARTAASADRMTSGRLILGLGTGYDQSEHDAIGVDLRRPGPRVTRLEQSVDIVRSLLDSGSCAFVSEHHQVALDDIGVRPTQERVPILIGGNGRRVVSLAGRKADIFQFTGLTHAVDGTPAAGGFTLGEVRQRRDWLEEAAGDRNDAVERSALVQITHIGNDVADHRTKAAAETEVPVEVIDETPFVLVGSQDQVIDKLERLREDVGISHFVVREPEMFAPIVAALSGN